MKDLLNKFENKEPEIVFNWKDAETEAEGWTVINSLRGGAAGGGQYRGAPGPADLPLCGGRDRLHPGSRDQPALLLPQQ